MKELHFKLVLSIIDLTCSKTTEVILDDDVERKKIREGAEGEGRKGGGRD